MKILSSPLKAAFCAAAVSLALFDPGSSPALAAPGEAATPAYGAWRNSKIGAGGNLLGFVFCPSDPRRCYTYVDITGVFRSDDAGATWRNVSAHMTPPHTGSVKEIRSIAVDPRNADVVLAAFGNKGGIYRTTDGGGTWNAVLPGVFYYANVPERWAGSLIAFQPGNPDTLLAATQGSGVFKSTDGGKTWNARKGLEGINATQLVFDAKNPERAWICARPGTMKSGPPGTYQGGFFVTENGGESWKRISEQSPIKIVQDPQTPSTLYSIYEEREIKISADAGETWTLFMEGLSQGSSPDGEKDLQYLYHALDAGPDFILCGSFRGQIHRLQCGKSRWEIVPIQSIDYDGKVWKASDHPQADVDHPGNWPPNQFGIPGCFRENVGHITVDPADPKHWSTVDWQATYQTYDAGRTWKLSQKGIECTAIFNLEADPVDPKRVYLCMADWDFMISTDGGDTFAQNPVRFPSQSVRWLDLSDADPDHLLAVANNMKVKGPWKANKFFTSSDKGVTWKASPMTGLADPASHFFQTFAFNPAKAKEVYAAASGEAKENEGGVYQSLDGGETWTWHGQGLSGNLFSSFYWSTRNQLAVHPSGTMLLFGAESKKAYRWDDKEWVSLSFKTSEYIHFAADPGSASTFYAGVDQVGVHRSTDGGKTWTLVYPYDGQIHALLVDPKKEGRVAVALDKTVIWSANGGTSWDDLDTERNLPCRLRDSSFAFSGNRLLLGSNAAGVFWTELPKE